jgi:hypothetical protein
MMSDESSSADGNNFIGTCYQGFMDGGEFWYMIEVTDVCSVVVWAEITGRNRKQEGLLTEH